MKTADITDLQVVRAYAASRADRGRGWPYEILQAETGAPEKVAYSACERADRHGLIEYGVSLRSGWLTEKGKALLESSKA